MWARIVRRTTKTIIGVTTALVVAAGMALAGTATASASAIGNPSVCGSGYQYVKGTVTNVETGKPTSKMLVALYRKLNTVCAVTFRTGSAHGHPGYTMVVMSDTRGSYARDDEGRYKYYAGPLKHTLKAGHCVLVQGQVGSIVSPLVKYCR